jgi:prepilin-type N-terminal cleavage/methylation domain-containing protein
MSTRRAFTLIELMITVLIIGMILGIAVPNFRQAHLRAREATLRSDLRTYRAGLHAFLSDTGCYPSALAVLDDTTAPSACTAPGGNGISLAAARWRGPYVIEVRTDPVSQAALSYAAAAGAVTSSATGNDSRGAAYSTY